MAEVWIFNSSIAYNISNTFSCPKAKSGDYTLSSITWDQSSKKLFYKDDSGSYTVYGNTSETWTNNKYKIIRLATTPVESFLSFLKANATKQKVSIEPKVFNDKPTLSSIDTSFDFYDNAMNHWTHITVATTGIIYKDTTGSSIVSSVAYSKDGETYTWKPNHQNIKFCYPLNTYNNDSELYSFLSNEKNIETDEIIIVPDRILADIHFKGKDNTDYLCFTAQENNISIKIIKDGSPTSIPTLEYSTNKTDWNSFTIGQTTIKLDNKEKVYFRGNNNTFNNSETDFCYFVISGSTKASGNIMTLIDATGQSESLANKNYCFAHLFEDCTSLITAPSLPATTLAQSCYKYMFNNCYSLTTAPELPATTLADECYYSMFWGCTSLVTAPKLPATTLANSCYVGMFQDCTSLATAPILSATELTEYCYASMFYNCTSLTATPELPAETLAIKCYDNMFNGCTSLTTVLKLPAETLENYCYNNMFKGCTSLTAAPELPATALATGCYLNMFNGCASLKYIKIGYTGNFSTGYYFNDWVYNVAATGDFYYGGSDTTRGVSAIPTGWTLHDSNIDYLCFTAKQDNVTIQMKSQNIPTYTLNLQTSTDGGITWEDFTAGNTGGTQITLAETGNKVLFKGTNVCINNSSNIYYYFKITGGTSSSLALASVSGNIMTLLDGEDPQTDLTGKPACFACLFKNCPIDLDSTFSLPATTLALGCYFYMFQNCTFLTTSPRLPATTLAQTCYDGMFKTCTSLITAPKLPAEILAPGCYLDMFYDCTSLVTAPELPATILQTQCYDQMFYNCASLQVYTTSGTGHDKAWRIPTSGTGTTASSALSYMFYGTTGGVTTPTINTTYYTQNEPV